MVVVVAGAEGATVVVVGTAVGVASEVVVVGGWGCEVVRVTDACAT